MKKLLIVLICFLLPLCALAQGIKVSGRVTEPDGKGGSLPIAGVVVMQKGGSNGTMTDSDGRYSISVPSSSVLLFSSLGYADVEEPVSGRTVVNVEMQIASEQLEELVFIGYGAVRKSDLVTSVTSVKAEDMKLFPAATAAEMLRGRAAGVTVKASSGEPGSVPSITIRGSRSISASNTPLYVIDGSVASDTEFAMMSADDIESVEILKDAASQAIYGARASDGVILVTTKRGKEGKSVVSYSGYAGVQVLTRNFNFYNGDEWLALRAEGVANDKGIADSQTIPVSEVLSDPIMLDAYKNGVYVDWEKLMFHPAMYHNHEIGVRGGSDKTKLSASIGYYDQDGIMAVNSSYQRLSARVNIDHKVRKWLTVGVNSSFGWTSKDAPNGAWYTFLTRTPLAKVYDDDGNYSPYINSKGDRNPLYSAQHDQRKTISNNYRVNAFADVTILKGLSYRLNASYYNRVREEGKSRDSYYPGGGSTASLYSYTTINRLLENIVNYAVPVGGKHHLTLTGVQSFDQRHSKDLGYAVQNLPVDKNWNFLANGEATELGRSYGINNLVSFMARAQYNYADKYLLTLAVRRDGSSRFGAEHKWGNFPSAAFAWRASQEEFMKNADWINSLKLRASYGIVGNQNGIDNYTTLGLAKAYAGEFGDTYYLGYLPGNELSNANLRWEKSATANLGVDFGLFDNRLNGSVEYYSTRTTDLLVGRSVNASLGYTSMLDNLGETHTNGLDINLNADILRSKDWGWTATVNFSKFNNEIIKIDDTVDENGKPVSQPGNNWIIGAPINIYYDYKKEGIYQYDDFDCTLDGAGNLIVGALLPTVDKDKDGVPDSVLERDDVVRPGSVKLADVNGDGVINIDDRVVYKRDPDFTMSLSSTLRWKNLDLYMDWYASYGGFVRNPILYDNEYGGDLRGTFNGCKVDYWTPYNPVNTFPRPMRGAEIPYLRTCAYQDASYLRLRTLQLGFNFPVGITRRIGLGSLRFYATATNVLTFTKVLSYSPEVMASSYPETKQYVFGLNLTF